MLYSDRKLCTLIGMDSSHWQGRLLIQYSGLHQELIVGIMTDHVATEQATLWIEMQKEHTTSTWIEQCMLQIFSTVELQIFGTE